MLLYSKDWDLYTPEFCFIKRINFNILIIITGLYLFIFLIKYRGNFSKSIIIDEEKKLLSSILK